MPLGSEQTHKVLTDGDPYTHAVAVVLTADTDLSQPSLLYVGGAGDVKVDTLGGNTVTYVGFKAGNHLPVVVTKVYSTANGTTATDLIAGWRA